MAKARIQLLFLSSQYPCAKLARHWSFENPLGLCTNDVCYKTLQVESVEHILLHCPAYSATRLQLIQTCLNVKDPNSLMLISDILVRSNTDRVQFLLDCSILPEVIRTAQCHGEHIYSDLFYLSRTWCYAIHRERLKRLHKWNFQ